MWMNTYYTINILLRYSLLHCCTVFHFSWLCCVMSSERDHESNIITTMMRTNFQTWETSPPPAWIRLSASLAHCEVDRYKREGWTGQSWGEADLVNKISSLKLSRAPLSLSVTLILIVSLLTPCFVLFCFCWSQLNMIRKKWPDRLLLNTQPAWNYLQVYIGGWEGGWEIQKFGNYLRGFGGRMLIAQVRSQHHHIHIYHDLTI